MLRGPRVTALLIVPTVFVLAAFVREAVQAVSSIRIGMELGHYAWANSLWEHLQDRFPQFVPSDLGTELHNYAERGAAIAAGRVGEILRHTAELLLDLTFAIFSMFYFFRDGETIVERLRNGLPFEESQRLMVVENTAPPCSSYQCGRSVPPPAKLMRSGAFDRIIMPVFLAPRCVTMLVAQSALVMLPCPG